MTQEEFISSVQGDETRWWLCEGRGDGAHATVVLGWSKMVRLLATECIDCDASEIAIRNAEAWLTDFDAEWDFGHNNTAQWEVSFEDGGWAVTLVTDASAIIAP